MQGPTVGVDGTMRPRLGHNPVSLLHCFRAHRHGVRSDPPGGSHNPSGPVPSAPPHLDLMPAGEVGCTTAILSGPLSAPHRLWFSDVSFFFSSSFHLSLGPTLGR